MDASSLKDTVVIYHAQCTDGFGAAYAAWKTFGDTATYLPLKTQTELPHGLIDKELYVLDYSFAIDTLRELEKVNKRVIVIDHHQSAKEAVTAFPQHIFDESHSGAVLSWQYFHPDTDIPELLLQVEDHDLWKFVRQDNMAFNAALRQYEHNFETWDKLIADLKDKTVRDTFLKEGASILAFEEKLIAHLMSFKERVLFEGHKVWALNVSRVYRSVLGNKLAELNAENGGIALGIVYYHNSGAVHISLRSKGDVDVAAIAEKYGGGGHKNAASIRAESFAKLPFTFV